MSTLAGAVARVTTHSILTPGDSTVVNAVKLGGRSLVRTGAVAVAAIEMVALGCLGALVRGLSFCVFGELRKRLTVFSQSMLGQARSAFSEAIASYSVTVTPPAGPTLLSQSNGLRKSVQSFIFTHRYAIAASFVVVIALTAYAMRNPTVSLPGTSSTPPPAPFSTTTSSTTTTATPSTTTTASSSTTTKANLGTPLDLNAAREMTKGFIEENMAISWLSKRAGGAQVSQLEVSEWSQSLEGIRWLASQWEPSINLQSSPSLLLSKISEIVWVSKIAVTALVLPSIWRVGQYAFGEILSIINDPIKRSKLEVCTEISFVVLKMIIGKTGEEAISLGEWIWKHRRRIVTIAVAQLALYAFVAYGRDLFFQKDEAVHVDSLKVCDHFPSKWVDQKTRIAAFCANDTACETSARAVWSYLEDLCNPKKNGLYTSNAERVEYWNRVFHRPIYSAEMALHDVGVLQNKKMLEVFAQLEHGAPGFLKKFVKPTYPHPDFASVKTDFVSLSGTGEKGVTLEDALDKLARMA